MERSNCRANGREMSDLQFMPFMTCQRKGKSNFDWLARQFVTTTAQLTIDRTLAPVGVKKKKVALRCHDTWLPCCRCPSSWVRGSV